MLTRSRGAPLELDSNPHVRPTRILTPIPWLRYKVSKLPIQTVTLPATSPKSPPEVTQAILQSTPTTPNCAVGSTGNGNSGDNTIYNPNALNGSCSLKGAALGTIGKTEIGKEDPLRVLQSLLLYLLPLFVFSGLRYRSELSLIYRRNFRL